MGESPVVLGLDFGGSKIAAAVCDLAGHRLGGTTVSTGTVPGVPQPGSGHGAQVIFDRGIRAARDLLADVAPDSDLAAVGAATFGIPFEDKVDLAPAISGWESLALGRELRAAFAGAKVRMATDAKAAAMAELRWGSLNGCDPGVYLNLGTGLAAAIVIGGRVVAGGNGAAGEIGYNLRAISDVGRALDQRMPLEAMVSGLGLARHAAAPRPAEAAAPAPGTGGPGTASAGTAAPGVPPPPPMTAADIFEAGPGNPELDELLTRFVAELAFHLVNLAIFLNPVRISVGGGMVRSWERLRPHVENALSAGVPYPPELVVARFPFDAPLLGAVALAVDAAEAGDARTFGPQDRDDRLATARHVDQENIARDTVTLDSTA